MNSKLKLAIFVVCALAMIGFLIYDFAAGHVGYRTVKGVGVVIIIGYIVYTYFSSNRESEL